MGRLCVYPTQSRLFQLVRLDHPSILPSPSAANSSDAIISWSDLYALYRLPDGSAWAEHSYLHDADDVGVYESLDGVEARDFPQGLGLGHCRLYLPVALPALPASGTVGSTCQWAKHSYLHDADDTGV